MRKISLSIIIAGFLVILGGCKKDFLDINQDPNRPTEANITPNLITAARLNAIAAQNATFWDFLNRYMGYWSASGSYSRATVEMSYNITNTTGEGIWNSIYYNLNQLKSIETKAAEREWKFYQGIARIMSAHQWQTLVDLYGDVPFETALDLTGNIRPTYTDDQEIYRALIPMIDEGLALIKAAGSDPNISTQDIMFQGNKTNWAKFANTLKLRLLLHAYKTNTFNAQAEIGKITSEGSGFLGNGLSAEVQPGYTNSKPNPYYAAHLHLENGNEADNYNRANCFALNLMTSMNDLRYTRFYRTAKSIAASATNPLAQYRCTNYGANPLDDNNSDRTSGPGYGLIKLPVSVFTTPPSAAAAAGASQPMWVITSVEAMFLVAEATARGWLPGNAQTVLNNAIRESFTYLGLTTAQADTYIEANTNPTANPRVVFSASATTDQKVTAVIWQKYIALNGLQGNEIWTDWRRTGIVQPPLSIAPERGSNPIPRRLLYPSAEYSYNAENAPSGISQFNSRVFWDQQ